MDEVSGEGRAVLDTSVVIADDITPIPGLLTSAPPPSPNSTSAYWSPSPTAFAPSGFDG
ncbi:hypothetical protein [Nocardia sp. AG03]|uniref:hypothetical protein n=1 Tax=Nocardia sp. AG03 TaxID=3025312 RepID=UPI00241858B8|nr:hypothetical protein [Nocardia sp. AG03]